MDTTSSKPHSANSGSRTCFQRASGGSPVSPVSAVSAASSAIAASVASGASAESACSMTSSVLAESTCRVTFAESTLVDPDSAALLFASRSRYISSQRFSAKELNHEIKLLVEIYFLYHLPTNILQALLGKLPTQDEIIESMISVVDDLKKRYSKFTDEEKNEITILHKLAFDFDLKKYDFLLQCGFPVNHRCDGYSVLDLPYHFNNGNLLELTKYTLRFAYEQNVTIDLREARIGRAYSKIAQRYVELRPGLLSLIQNPEQSDLLDYLLSHKKRMGITDVQECEWIHNRPVNIIEINSPAYVCGGVGPVNALEYCFFSNIDDRVIEVLLKYGANSERLEEWILILGLLNRKKTLQLIYRYIKNAFAIHSDCIAEDGEVVNCLQLKEKIENIIKKIPLDKIDSVAFVFSAYVIDDQKESTAISLDGQLLLSCLVLIISHDNTQAFDRFCILLREIKGSTIRNHIQIDEALKIAFNSRSRNMVSRLMNEVLPSMTCTLVESNQLLARIFYNIIEFPQVDLMPMIISKIAGYLLFLRDNGAHLPNFNFMGPYQPAIATEPIFPTLVNQCVMLNRDYLLYKLITTYKFPLNAHPDRVQGPANREDNDALTYESFLSPIALAISRRNVPAFRLLISHGAVLTANDLKCIKNDPVFFLNLFLSDKKLIDITAKETKYALLYDMFLKAFIGQVMKLKDDEVIQFIDEMTQENLIKSDQSNARDDFNVDHIMKSCDFTNASKWTKEQCDELIKCSIQRSDRECLTAAMILPRFREQLKLLNTFMVSEWLNVNNAEMLIWCIIYAKFFENPAMIVSRIFSYGITNNHIDYIKTWLSLYNEPSRSSLMSYTKMIWKPNQPFVGIHGAQTPLQLAVKHNAKEIAQLIVTAYPDSVNIAPGSNLNIREVIVISGRNAKQSRKLTRPVLSQASNSYFPLSLAIDNENIMITRLLILMNADIFASADHPNAISSLSEKRDFFHRVISNDEKLASSQDEGATAESELYSGIRVSQHLIKSCLSRESVDLSLLKFLLSSLSEAALQGMNILFEKKLPSSLKIVLLKKHGPDLISQSALLGHNILLKLSVEKDQSLYEAFLDWSRRNAIELNRVEMIEFSLNRCWQDIAVMIINRSEDLICSGNNQILELIEKLGKKSRKKLSLKIQAKLNSCEHLDHHSPGRTDEICIEVIETDSSQTGSGAAADSSASLTTMSSVAPSIVETPIGTLDASTTPLVNTAAPGIKKKKTQHNGRKRKKLKQKSQNAANSDPSSGEATTKFASDGHDDASINGEHHSLCVKLDYLQSLMRTDTDYIADKISEDYISTAESIFFLLKLQDTTYSESFYQKFNSELERAITQFIEVIKNTKIQIRSEGSSRIRSPESISFVSEDDEDSVFAGSSGAPGAPGSAGSVESVGIVRVNGEEPSDTDNLSTEIIYYSKSDYNDALIRFNRLNHLRKLIQEFQSTILSSITDKNNNLVPPEITETISLMAIPVGSQARMDPLLEKFIDSQSDYQKLYQVLSYSDSLGNNAAHYAVMHGVTELLIELYRYHPQIFHVPNHRGDLPIALALMSNKSYNPNLYRLVLSIYEHIDYVKMKSLSIDADKNSILQRAMTLNNFDAINITLEYPFSSMRRNLLSHTAVDLCIHKLMNSSPEELVGWIRVLHSLLATKNPSRIYIHVEHRQVMERIIELHTEEKICRTGGSNLPGKPNDADFKTTVPLDVLRQLFPNEIRCIEKYGFYSAKIDTCPVPLEFAVISLENYLALVNKIQKTSDLIINALCVEASGLIISGDERVIDYYYGLVAAQTRSQTSVSLKSPQSLLDAFDPLFPESESYEKYLEDPNRLLRVALTLAKLRMQFPRSK